MAGSDAVNGTQYRCTVTDTYGQTATSEPATLTVRTPMTISDLPSMTVVEGNNVTFSIEATGDNLTYQWQTGVAPTSDDTPIEWTNINNATSSTYTFKTKYTDDGRLYRCLVTDAYETLNSSVATLTVTPAYTVISNTTKEISMNLGDACQLDATGTGLRYYSNSKALTVDKNGVVTANDVATGYVFVLDKYGHKTYYKIHVIDAFEALAFDELVISVHPDETVRLYTNKDAYQMVSDEDKTAVNWDYYWNYNYYGEYADFTGFIPGLYTVIAYTDNGEIATCEINVEGDVTDAALNTAYNGLIEVDPEDPDFNEYAVSNNWYRYVNDTNNDLMLTFDTSTIEATETVNNATYSVYFKNYFNKPVVYSAEELETAQIYLDPGEEIYIRPQVNDMMDSHYDFTISAAAYTPVAYTLGTTVNNVVLNRTDYSEYTFTTNASGEYELTASSRTPFYWQVEDVENHYEAVQYGNESSAVLKAFNLEPNHQYAIRFTPQNKADEGTLTFTLAKAEDTIINGTVNTQYNSDNTSVLRAGNTTYYKFDLGDAEINNIYNVYEFTETYVDGVSYSVLDSDMYTEYELFSSSNGYRLYIDEPTTIYIKVTNNGSSAIVPEFILREYDRSMTQVDDVEEGSNEISAYDVQCYEFTAPENGTYRFNFAASEHNLSVNYEVYFGEDVEYSSEYSAYNDGWTYWYDAENNYHDGYENKLDMSYTLRAGEKVSIRVTGDFNADNAETVIPYDWSVSCEDAYPVTNLALNTPTSGATVEGQKQYFKFTAPKSGVYYFWSQARAHMYGDLYNDLGGDCLTSANGSGDYGNFCISYHMKAGQTVYLCPREYYNNDVEYQVVVSQKDSSAKFVPAFSHTALTLGEKAEGVYNDGYSYDSFSFTATEAGSYVFTSYSDCDMYGNLYSDSTLNNLVASDDDSYGNNQFRIVYDLEAGQTVYLKPTADSYYYDYHASYSVRVINAEQDFSDKTTDALSPVAVTAEMEVEPNSYTIDEKTAYFRLNADENVSTYTFDIQNVEQTESMTVTFYYSNGFEIIPDAYVTLAGGTTDDDGMLTVSFDPFAFGGDGYIFVKIETSENNIGDVNISYTYDADENVQGGDEEEEEDIIATLTESNSGAQVTSSSNRAIIKVEHVDSDYYGTILVYLYTGNTATAWISYSDTPSFDDVSDDAETDTSFVLDAFNGPFYVMVESQDGNAIGDVSVSFIGNGPVAQTET